MTTTATAACFASAWVGYVADRSGDLYATHDAGRSWAEVERAPSRPEQFVGPWSDLSCNGTNIWLGLQLICAAPVLQPARTSLHTAPMRLLVVDNRK